MDNTNALTAKTSAAILEMVRLGMAPDDALRSVCGAEVVDKMIDSLYMDLRIAAAEKELRMREVAAKNLNGIPAIQNATAIERLCDTLTTLNIARIESWV